MAPPLLCDAMLGGLARWLRALGHRAAFEPFIADADLVRRAAAKGEIILSSDAPLFERRAFRGPVRGLFVPRHAPIEEQLAFVMRKLALPVLPPRCMACGGALAAVVRAMVADRIPRELPAQRFSQCANCARVFWHGTHWARIAKVREAMRAAALEGSPPDAQAC